MCYAAGSTQKYNLIGRALGNNAFTKYDPAAKALQKTVGPTITKVDNKVDAQMTKWFDSEELASRDRQQLNERIATNQSLLTSGTIPPAARRPYGGSDSNAAVGQTLLGS